MENFHSIKIYKFLLDLCWYSFIVVICIWALVNIFSVAFDGVVRASDLFTFKIQAQSVNKSPFKFSNTFDFSMVKPAEIEVQLNSFKVSQLGKPFILLYIVSFLISATLMLFQLKLLRDFLRNIISEKIFSRQNVSKLKYIAFLELLTVPLSIVYYLIADTLFKNSEVLGENFIFVTDYVGSFEPIVSALEYFVFAAVFSFGLKLKQEQDLTI